MDAMDPNNLNSTGNDEKERLHSPTKDLYYDEESARKNRGFNISRTNSSSSSDNNEQISWGVSTNRQTIIGRVRKCGSLNRLEVFLFVTTMTALLAGVYFNTMVFMQGTSKDVVFSLLIILDSLFILFYLTHGVLTEAFFELMALSFSMILISLLFIVNYLMPDDTVLETTDYYSMIAFLLLTVVTVIVATKLAWQYWISGNLIFRTVGGDMKLQKMCRSLLLAQSLLAFDAQWTLNNLVLVFQDGVSGSSNEQQLLLFTGLSLVGLWLFIGYVAMRYESMYLSWLFAGTSLFQPIYILYLFVNSIISGPTEWNILNVSIFMAGTVCLLTHFSLLAVFVTVAFNYGKGLCEKVYGVPSTQSVRKNTEPPMAVAPADADEQQPLLSNQPGTSRGPRRYSSFPDEDLDAIHPAP